MAVHQGHDVSSDDTAISQSPSEKVPGEAPSPAQEPEHEMAVRRNDESIPEENEVEKQPSGEPLDRTPSQAQKMGKKKIILVMGALCVRTPASVMQRRLCERGR